MRLTIRPPDARLAAAGAAAAAVLALVLASRSAPDDPLPSALPAATAAAERTQPAPVPAPAAAPSLDGLRLYGLLGSGAVIGLPNGTQRWIPVGREVLPGLRLEQVTQHHAVLAWSGGTMNLSFDGSRDAATPDASAAAAPARANDPLQEDRLRYRLGLAPQRVNGRIAGFALRREAELPALRRAGLRPGDVLVGVNGQTFDSEEKVHELASEIAGSFTAEFEFLRNGRRMRASLEVNPRR